MASSASHQLFAVTAPGLESIALGELKKLGVKGRVENGGVSYRGDAETIYSTNLWLRTASRVIVRIARFHASSFHELERRARSVPWGGFMPGDAKIRLRVTCRKSRLYHSDAVAERVLNSIAKGAPGVTRVEGSAADSDVDPLEEWPGGSAAQLFIVRLVEDECEISADTSGELLHRRGYRQEIAKAPLRETLAAAMVLASGWKSTEPLIDPMCGSGTIPIEAALLARGMAPGLRRRFAFMDWPTFEPRRWQENVVRAEARITENPGLEIMGSDRDTGAVQASRNNAERAGVARDIQFSERPLSESVGTLDDFSRPGWILTNPPYGVRLGDTAGLVNLYGKLGSALKSGDGWRLGILTSDATLARQTGLPLRARFSTRNGGIPVAFFGQEKDSATGTLASINISGGGVPKRRVSGAKVSFLGLQGDDQEDKVHHGGPERAVCLFSLEKVRALQAEGHPIQPGSAGENLTVEGIPWESVMPGIRLKVGTEVLLEITSFTSPCKTIRRSFIDGRFVRISQKVNPGWSRVYARVVVEGSIGTGDRIEILQGWE